MANIKFSFRALDSNSKPVKHRGGGSVPFIQLKCQDEAMVSTDEQLEGYMRMLHNDLQYLMSQHQIEIHAHYYERISDTNIHMAKYFTDCFVRYEK